MTLRHGSLTIDIAPTVDSTSNYERPLPGGAPGIAFAQSAPAPKSTNIEDIMDVLDADNPIIRENARRDLAVLGSSATPQIEAALTDPQTSLRVRLEVLIALSTMRPIALSLSGPARCAIADAAHDPDEALRKAATNLLTAGVHAPRTCTSPRGADKPQAVSQAVLHTIQRTGILSTSPTMDRQDFSRWPRTEPFTVFILERTKGWEFRIHALRSAPR